MLGLHPYHVAGEKYLTALLQGAGAIPLIIPAFGPQLPPEALLGTVDGLLFTGSPSNVEPRHYGGEPSLAGTLHDPQRDATTLPLIPLAIDAGLPVLAICRGFQEMNVALGGTLWQRLHELPGHLDHREDEGTALEAQYGPAHEVLLAPDGLLRRLAGADRVRVNSLHAQGVRTLAPGVTVEATAPDGVVEAFHVDRARSFALALQWHPEWRLMDNPLSRALFEQFGAACRAGR